MNITYITRVTASIAPIKFFGSPGTLFCEFSPGHVLPILIKGTRWPSLQHYFEAQHYSINPDIVEEIKQIPTNEQLFRYLAEEC
jgi:predicted NAD-dependent protein-ADP-ribosyltransferase YbiA (DUF1768 family)